MLRPPFQIIPKLLSTHIVLHTAKMLNYFPTKGGISDSLVTNTIISGETLYFKNHLHLHLGYYCQVHAEEIPQNSKYLRTKGAICLGPSGNLQGRYKFMVFNSGMRIFQENWDLISMPDTVIARVNILDIDQPKILTLTDRCGSLIGDVYTPGVGDN